MYRLRSFLSFDRIMLSATGAGCGLLFYQAHQEGNRPLHGQKTAQHCQFESDQRIELTSSICRNLERNGFVVIDNFLNREEIQEAISCAESLDFVQSPNERNGDLVRTDMVSFFEKNDISSNVGMNVIQQSLHRLSYDIFSSNFAGFGGSDQYSKSWVGVPSMMQIGMYDVLNKHNNKEKQGSFYSSHVDACSDSFWSLGVLGWIRSKYLRRRYLTCIVYLNQEWQQEDGGCLRIFCKDGSIRDVEPLEGRLVIFSSVNITHAVLPTFAKRLACTVWMTINPN